jgi:tetratricopeptide (TPR) repeat protein
MRLLVILLVPFALGAQQVRTVSPATPEQLIDARRFDEAKAAIDTLFAGDRNNVNALYYIGRLEYARGNSGKAVDWFEKAVQRNDNSALYHTWLGNALGSEAQRANKLRQPFLARRVKSEYERAVALDPTSIDAREGLVSFYSIAPGIMGGDMNKAREQANAIVKLDPIRGNFQLARVAERAKDLAAAESAYKSVITAAPDSSIGYYGLASFYRNQSRWDDAFSTYDQLMKLKPDEMPVHLTWAGTAAQSGKNLERGEREAKFYIENAKDAPPANLSNVHWRLGQIYEQTARRDLARAEYTEALRINPENQNAKRSLDALK